MGQTLSEYRWAENEVYFRQRNKGTIDNVAELKKTAADDDQEEIIENMAEDKLLFYCECANEKCRERIELKVKDYEKYHISPSRFIIKPGHNQPEIERIVAEGGTFDVVEKFIEPPSEVPQLNATDL